MKKDKTNKINALLAKLDADKNVSLRDLRSALGDEGVVEYEGKWQYELERRAEFGVKPVAIKDYEEILKKADFANNRADGIKINSRSKRDNYGRYSNQRLRGEAESFCEDALERLEEIIAVDSSLGVWFDRNLDFTTDGTLYADVTGVPRVVTSRSVHNLAKGFVNEISKESIKREVLENALGSDREVGLEDGVKIKGLLAKLKRTD